MLSIRAFGMVIIMIIDRNPRISISSLIHGYDTLLERKRLHHPSVCTLHAFT